MNNNSYVYIPADKLAEIIKQCCPPNLLSGHVECIERDECIDPDCLKCWKDWLKDGE